MDDVDLKSKYWEFYNPMMSIEYRLDYAVGAVHFNDRVIANLRQRIAELEQQLNATTQLDRCEPCRYEEITPIGGTTTTKILI
jgi:hypothetical protein